MLIFSPSVAGTRLPTHARHTACGRACVRRVFLSRPGARSPLTTHCVVELGDIIAERCWDPFAHIYMVTPRLSLRQTCFSWSSPLPLPPSPSPCSPPFPGVLLAVLRALLDRPASQAGGGPGELISAGGITFSEPREMVRGRPLTHGRGGCPATGLASHSFIH